MAAGLASCSLGQTDESAEPAVDPPAKPQPSAPAPTPQGDEEDALPSHQYRGVAGFRAAQDGKCLESYTLKKGLCVHDRLSEARSPQELALAMKAFMDGAVPPIVADAPTRAQRDPSKMHPGDLQATAEELRKRAEGRSMAPSDAPLAAAGEPGAPAAPGSGKAVAQVDPQQKALLQSGVRLLGAGLSGPSTGGGADMQEAKQMIGQLQTITDDGQVDIGEAGQLFQMLGQQLDGMELPPEMRTPSGPRGLRER